MIIFPFHNLLFGQKTSDSYQKLWETIQNDSIRKGNKKVYLDVYIKKARVEKNIWEEYRALEKKSFLVSYSEAVILLEQMKPLVDQISNDSLKGYFLNRNVGVNYKNRTFKTALDYAIESEVFNEQIKSLYNLHSVRIDIGNIYYHTRNYDKAIYYYLQAKDYYKNQKDYNHQRAYIVTLYSLGKAYWQLGNRDALSKTIEESEQVVTYLKPYHQILEKGYISYLKGGLAFLDGDYMQSEYFFKEALPVLQKNEDTTNEHVLYLYLGKIAWLENNKSKAVDYFNRVDDLFYRKKFLNYELREAYEYLIAYYEEIDQPKLQLKATESLILLNRQFEIEQQEITNALHNDLDNSKLKRSKEQLQKQIKIDKNKYTIGVLILGSLLFLVLIYSFRQNREKKKLKLKFNNLLESVQRQKNSEAKNFKVNEFSKKDSKKVLNVTEKRLLHELGLFEKRKGFLYTVKLDDLAVDFGTNRNTLSVVLNKYKGGFTNYINTLRIQQLLLDLTDQPHLREYTMAQLAENYGFTNAKTLTNQFKTETGLTPSYFIKQLEMNYYSEKA